MNLLRLFVHVPEQGDSNPFALKHFCRFLPLGLLVIICAAAVIQVATLPARRVLEKIFPVSASVRTYAVGKGPYPAGRFTGPLGVGGLDLHQFASRGGIGTAAVLDGRVVAETLSPTKPIFSATSGKWDLAVTQLTSKRASPLTLAQNLMMSWLITPGATISLVDVESGEMLQAALPESGYVSDVSSDGAFMSFLRTDFGELREAMLVETTRMRAWGTGMRACDAYFDDYGRLVVVSVREIRSFNVRTMSSTKHVLEAGDYIDPRDGQRWTTKGESRSRDLVVVGRVGGYADRGEYPTMQDFRLARIITSPSGSISLQYLWRCDHEFWVSAVSENLVLIEFGIGEGMAILDVKNHRSVSCSGDDWSGRTGSGTPVIISGGEIQLIEGSDRTTVPFEQEKLPYPTNEFEGVWLP